MRLKLVALFVTLVAAPAFAWELRADVSESRDFLSLSGDMSTFKLEEGSIAGNGAKVDFAHYFGRKTSVELFLASAINASQSVSASFTGYGAHLLYVPFGDCCAERRAVQVDGRAVLTEDAETRSVFEIGLGLNQYLLNGSKGVYSASGVGGIVNYRFTMFSYQWKASARVAQMVSASVPIQAVFLSFGMALPL